MLLKSEIENTMNDWSFAPNMLVNRLIDCELITLGRTLSRTQLCPLATHSIW